MIPVDYDGLNLQLAPFKVLRLDVYGAASRFLQNEQLAKQDGSRTVYSKYESKTIVVEGQIKSSSQSALEQAIDILKTAVNKFERNLTIGYAGGERVFKCTQNNVQLTRDRGGSTYANFSIEFLSPDPYGIDDNNVSFIDTTVTVPNLSVSINNQGSYKAEPRFTITLADLLSAEGATITLGNPVLSQRVSIENDWANGDTIIIDCKEKDVFVNNLRSNYSGKIPEWAPGPGSLEWSDNFTQRTVGIEAQYKRKYL